MPIQIEKPDNRKPGKRGLRGKQGIQGVRGVQGVQGIAGKDGLNGIDGRDGKDGSKWYDGKGAPKATLGATGDFYLDNDTYDYYEKTTRWVKRGNLKGAKGDKGDKGDKGERGAKGAKGNDGGVGTPGADGAQGPQGPQGMQGVQGDPGVGVPVGGTAGQVLAKDTNADYDTTWVNPAGGAVDSVNGQTGVVVLDQDDIGDGTTYKQYSDTEKTKLAGIEAGADVTDATNVASAGAFMKSVDDTDDITVGSTNKFATSAEKTKLSHITVTQAVDLDTMESDIANKQPLDADLTSIAGLDSSTSGAIASDGAGWIKKTYAQLKTALGLVKADVGLGNVDNTSDANKPISTATQTALDGKVDENGAITGATKTKITYDAKGLVTAGADATTTDIAEGTNLYFTDERVDDRVDALIQDSAVTAPGITWAYDDGANTLTPTVKQSYDVFIYKSTGSQVGNRYNSWSDLMTAISKQEGAKTIFFEQNETIPAGSWNLDYVTLKGNGLEYNAGGYTLTFGDNTTISSWLVPSFHSLLLKSTSTTGHICTFTGAFNLVCDTVSNVQSSSSYEFFASSYAGQNIIALRNSARWSLIAGLALFKFTGSAYGQQVILSRGDGAVVTNNTLSSTNAQILIDIIGSVNQNLAKYPITNTGFTVGVGVYLTLTNVSALAYYPITITSSDSPYTLVSESGLLLCNSASGNITVNLPAAYGGGRLVTVVKTSASNTVTLDGNASETINGATTYAMTADNAVVQIVDGASGKWYITSTG